MPKVQWHQIKIKPPNQKEVTYLVFRAVDSMDAVVKATGKYSRRALKAR
jgi:hypothetical protein